MQLLRELAAGPTAGFARNGYEYLLSLMKSILSDGNATIHASNATLRKNIYKFRNNDRYAFSTIDLLRHGLMC